MTPEQFSALAEQGYNHIPITQSVLADLDTPLSSYIKAAAGDFSYLLESAGQGGEKWSRYSMVGLPAETIIRVVGEQISVESKGVVIEQFEVEDPLAYIEAFQARYRYPSIPDLPIYTGGLVGYFGYDTVRYVEKKLRYSMPKDTIGAPDILLMVSNDVLVFDNVKGLIHLITHANPEESQALDNAFSRLDAMRESLRQPVTPSFFESPQGPTLHEEDFVQILS
jgi:anthranilate synthase component 1